MGQKMRYIRNWDVQKPYHNVVLFFLQQKANVNPEKYHEESDEDSESKKHVRVNLIEDLFNQILVECIIYEIYKVIVDVAKCVGFKTSESLKHFGVHQDQDIFQVLRLQLLLIFEFELDLKVRVQRHIVIVFFIEIKFIIVDWIQSPSDIFCQILHLSRLLSYLLCILFD